MPETHVNDGGVWKQPDEIHVNDVSTWKSADEKWVNDGGVWKQVWPSAAALPTGIILPFVGSTIPSGWSQFNSANNRFIVGAGSSYSVGSIGGNDTVSISSAATSEDGDHTGDSFQAFAGGGGGGTNFLPRFTGSDGAHTHSWTDNSVDTVDEYRNYILIQASSDQDVAPGDSAVLSHQALSTGDKSLIHGAVDRLMRAAASAGTEAGSSTWGISDTTSSDGIHSHVFTFQNTEGVEFAACTNHDAGNHNHLFSGTLTLDTKHRYLTLYSSASSFVVESGSIAFWPNATAPTGWLLCDGNNGTPDLRDYFIRVGSAAQRNGTGGDNNSAWSGTTNTAGAHSHGCNSTTQNYASDFNAHHTDTEGDHSHTDSGTKETTMSYYALTAIMKA